jgi:hypothetical protein
MRETFSINTSERSRTNPFLNEFNPTETAIKVRELSIYAWMEYESGPNTSMHSASLWRSKLCFFIRLAHCSECYFCMHYSRLPMVWSIASLFLGKVLSIEGALKYFCISPPQQAIVSRNANRQDAQIQYVVALTVKTFSLAVHKWLVPTNYKPRLCSSQCRTLPN